MRCKPTHKNTIGFESCLEEKPRYKYGLCRECFNKWLITDKGQEFIKSQVIPKAKKEVEKNKKKEHKDIIERNKSIARIINDTRTPFQKYIRLRDANDCCISCGTNQSSMWQAGHYKKAELFRGTIFDEINVNKQCYRCNIHLNGNESGYREGLVKKYGESAVLELENRANKLRAYEHTREELKSIRTLYNEKSKEFYK